MAIEPKQEKQIEIISSEDDWTLNPEQMLFMPQHNNAIETAYNNEDMDYLRELAASQEYKTIFREMSFDEACDRYECMLEEDSGDA